MATVYRGRERLKTAPGALTLGIGLPIRPLGPPEFWMSVFQMIPPLNVKIAYIVQKNLLPAAARNKIIEAALTNDLKYLLFLDDDVLFPDVTAYRLWTNLQLHPEASVITGVYTTKLAPPEPFIYADDSDGAYWDWPVGALVPIHSAGAGCFIVNLEYVKKLSPPWFQDKMSVDSSEDVKLRTWTGHDRYFMARLREETGTEIYADTGLLLGHMDVPTNTVYILPPEAPCFKSPVIDESFIPYVDPEGVIQWRRVIVRPDGKYKTYLQWLTEGTEQLHQMQLVPDAPPAPAEHAEHTVTSEMLATEV